MEHSNSSVSLVACTLPGQCSPTTKAVDLNANDLMNGSLREFPQSALSSNGRQSVTRSASKAVMTIHFSHHHF